MKNKHILSIIFIAISSLFFVLAAYLLITKITLHPQLFITTCGEVLKNIQEHVHFNSDGVLSSMILLVTAIGVSLALFQLVRFVVSYRRLHQSQKEEVLPDILKVIIDKHDLPYNFTHLVPASFSFSYSH